MKGVILVYIKWYENGRQVAYNILEDAAGVADSLAFAGSVDVVLTPALA